MSGSMEMNYLEFNAVQSHSSGNRGISILDNENKNSSFNIPRKRSAESSGQGYQPFKRIVEDAG